MTNQVKRVRRHREPCSIDGCEDLRVGLTFCGKHYQRFRKYGDPLFKKPNYGNRKPRVTPIERTCRVCGHVGPRSDFYNARNTCKPCQQKKNRQWRIDNPEKYEAGRERQRKSGSIFRQDLRRAAIRAGIDPDWFERYYAEHDGKCTICGQANTGGRRVAIDHDHATGEFRGMLCDNCNQGLGRFKDDPGLLRRAAMYLEPGPEGRGYPPIIEAGADGAPVGR